MKGAGILFLVFVIQFLANKAYSQLPCPTATSTKISLGGSPGNYDVSPYNPPVNIADKATRRFTYTTPLLQNVYYFDKVWLGVITTTTSQLQNRGTLLSGDYWFGAIDNTNNAEVIYASKSNLNAFRTGRYTITFFKIDKPAANKPVKEDPKP